MGWLMFWRQGAPDEEIPLMLWRSFMEAMVGLLLIGILVGAVVIVAGYAWHTRALKIRRPQDLFVSFIPMRWLAFALVPAVFVWYRYWVDFTTAFPLARISWVGGAVELAIICAVGAGVLGYALMLAPGVTPPRFRYRPVGLFTRTARTHGMSGATG